METMVFLRTGSGSCLERTVNPRRSGKPASISVASCRVKIIRVRPLIVFFSRKGMFRLILMSFLATDAEGAAALRLGALPPSVIDLGK